MGEYMPKNKRKRLILITKRLIHKETVIFVSRELMSKNVNNNVTMNPPIAGDF